MVYLIPSPRLTSHYKRNKSYFSCFLTIQLILATRKTLKTSELSNSAVSIMLLVVHVVTAMLVLSSIGPVPFILGSHDQNAGSSSSLKDFLISTTSMGKSLLNQSLKVFYTQ